MLSKIKDTLHTIRFKLILIFIIMFLIPFLLVETIIYRTIEDRALINTNDQMINSLKLVSDNTSTLLTEVQTDFQSIIFQEDFLMALFDIRDLSAITTKRQLDATEKLVDDFESFLDNDRIHSVYLYNKDNKVFYDFSYLSPGYLYDVIEETPWYEGYSHIYEGPSPSYEENWILNRSIPNIGHKSSTPLISYYSRFQSSSGHTTILSANISARALEDVIDSLQLPEGAYIHIADSNETIIASSSPAFYGKTLTNIYSQPLSNNLVLNEEEEKRHISYYSPPSLGYHYVIDIPYSHIIASAKESRFLLYGLYLAIVLVLLTMNLVIQRFLLKPINAMIKKMRHVEQGNFDISLPDNRKDELGILYRNFNDMTRNIHALIEKNYVEVLLRKQSDLNYIQTQLNEHFLYNTLDAIYSLIQIDDQVHAEEMLLSLSKFFRTTLNNGKQVIPLGEIVAMLKNYCRIMELRNNGKYTIEFDVDPDILDTYALKFLFQPLIENAIIHGVNNRRQGGRICIHLKKSEDSLVYNVWDNGRGIDDLTLRRLNQLFSQANSETQNEFFALNNIANQAKLYYKKDYSIHIESQMNVYTSCTVTLPIQYTPDEKGVFQNDQSHSG